MIHNYNSRLEFDPTYTDIDMNYFKDFDQKQFYGGVMEAIPPNVPEQIGKEVDTWMYVDRNYAGKKLLDDILQALLNSPIQLLYNGC